MLTETEKLELERAGRTVEPRPTPPGHAAASLLLQAVFRCEREIGAAISQLRWDAHLNVRAVHLDVNGNVRIDADLHPHPR